MPSKPIDYTNTHFYKIVCKDLNIKDCYVGHTTDFTKRKSQHKHLCYAENDKRYSIYLYEFIRENGGWDNWDMVEIEKKCCQDSLEAKAVERDLIEKHKAGLNRIKPYITTEEKTEYNKQWKQHNKEHLQEYMKNYKEQHTEELKQYSENYRQEKQDILREKGRLNYQNKKEQYKQYREDNKDILHERSKNHYEKNRSQVIQRTTENNRRRAEETIVCACGITVKKPNMWKHKKSIFHTNFINNQVSQNQQQENN